MERTMEMMMGIPHIESSQKGKSKTTIRGGDDPHDPHAREPEQPQRDASASRCPSDAACRADENGAFVFLWIPTISFSEGVNSNKSGVSFGQVMRVRRKGQILNR